VWTLPTRYVVAIALGVGLVAVSAFFVGRFADFLLVAFFCSVPATAFIKSFMLTSLGYGTRGTGILLYSGVLGVGLPDVLLVALYGTWFVRIFAARSAPLPRLQRTDALVALLILAYLASIPGTPDKPAAFFAVGYLLRFALVYFYVSRNFERRHLRWLFVAFFVIIFLETALASVQFLTGKLVGLAMDRGAGVRLDEQYTVPGIEHRNRATGTCYESHTFGLFMAMLAQYPFVMMSSRHHGNRYRLLGAALFTLATVASLVSFSRSAWISLAIAVLVGWGVHLFVWREREILVPTMFVGIVALLLSPWALSIVIERFASTGFDLLTARFDQFPVAWHVWRDHFVFGYGVGNYMEALETYNLPGVLNLPVHNAFLWLGAEAGVVGVLAFFSLAVGSLVRSWRVLRSRRDPAGRVALAVFGGLVAYLIDGLTNPLYREPGIYMLFWLSVGLSVALPRLDRGQLDSRSRQT
jgi:O-antigen ligase